MCPDGFKLETGNNNIPGRGFTFRDQIDLIPCANLCKEDRKCCSFEWSSEVKFDNDNWRFDFV